MMLILPITLLMMSFGFEVALHADSSPLESQESLSSPFDGVEGTLRGGVGTDSNDYFGFGGAVFLGSFMDPKNITGDVHFEYGASFQPEGDSSSQTSQQRATAWSGGVSMTPWPQGTVGFDYDSNSDPFEMLSGDGFRLEVGEGPFSVSYRIAREISEIPLDQQTASSGQGAFVYQETWQGSVEIKPTAQDTFFLTGSGSYFHPELASFSALIDRKGLVSLANLQSELQNFELWDTTLSWNRKWSNHWDSRVYGDFGHLVIAENPLVSGTVAVGYVWSPQIYTRLGFRYFYLPGNPIASVTTEIRFTLQRDE